MAWKIKFTIGGYWHNGLYTTEIFIDDDNLCNIVRGKADSIDIHDYQFRKIPDDDENFYRLRYAQTYSTKISDALLDELDALKIFSWDGFYGSHFILDGEHWALALTDGIRKHCCIGLNGYPENFDMFQAWINELLAETSK